VDDFHRSFLLPIWRRLAEIKVDKARENRRVVLHESPPAGAGRRREFLQAGAFPCPWRILSYPAIGI
jgi:hypothetical protein